MANKRISDLPEATSSTVGDVLPIDGTTTRKITVENLLDDNLVAIKGLTSAADKGIQFTGSGIAATYDLTAAGKALLDDANAAAQRTTLGLGSAAVASTSDFASAAQGATADSAVQPGDPEAVPLGGTTGQVLAKASNLNGDTKWVSGAGAGVNSVNGQTGALALLIQPQGRITLTSGVAVPATSVAAASTVYYTPAGGNQAPLYDGTNLVPTTFSELSQATTDTTKSPAAVANNSNYDLFLWNDSGTIRCTRGPAWSSSTSRGTGAGTTELQAVNGIYLNKNAITNGPAANRGTYVGTIRSNGSATIDWILGASGTAGVLGVWNNYNRVQVTTTAYDATATWTYSSGTIRQVRGSAVNQISFVSGLPEESIDASYAVAFNTASVVGAYAQAGLALDSSTAFDRYAVTTTPAANPLGAMIHARNGYAPQTGYHTIYALEGGDGTNSTTFVGSARQGLTLSTFM